MSENNEQFLEICIIESLRDTDKLTGTYLNENILRYKSFEFSDFNSRLITVFDKNEFFEALEKIIDEIKVGFFLPIIQLDTHGYIDGIELTSGEIVTWTELLDKTREINILLRNKLILILSLCSGNSIIGDFDIDKRAPFKAIVGSFKPVGQIDLQNALEEFYNSIFSTGSMITAVEKMNKIIDSEFQLFYLFTSDNLFDEMMQKIRLILINDIHINDLLDKIDENYFKMLDLQ